MGLTHFSLFSGIGGIDLASEWAGFTTIGQCEYADYPTKVLEKHWFDVPRWRDIRDVTLESVRSKGIRSVDLISGGFPCQPFSVAGKQKGKDDDRYLWPEMLRVIRELKPTWVLGENVAGIVNMALEQVCTDLENEGYEVQPFIIPARSVDAPHERKRVFIVSHSTGNGLQESNKHVRFMSKDTKSYPGFDKKEWMAEPGIQRVVDGIPDQLDRLKCLGNAVVPHQVYPILQAIADIERERTK